MKMVSQVILLSYISFFLSSVEGRPLKRQKIERTQLPENSEAAQDNLPYLDVDMDMGMDFGGDDFCFLQTRLKRLEQSHLGNDPDIGRKDEANDLRHSSEVRF
jgi:hypothetical protein